uniref:DUF1977 domain-containing protein n=1 Tax=Steinernema glaseri TaxID=37863 RepID=A0A1I8AV17_9BILA
MSKNVSKYQSNPRSLCAAPLPTSSTDYRGAMFVVLIVALLFSEGFSWNEGNHEDATNEAPSNDTFQIWMVVFSCLFFCAAVRHINDFYAGDTVTLVKEGTWGGRFKHKGEYRQMTAVEQNFAIMYEKMRVAERTAALHQQRYRPVE